MPMVRFTVSIDGDIKQKLDAFAAAEDYNRSQALEKILRIHFQAPESAPAPEETTSKKPERIDEIESHLISVMRLLAHQYDYLVSIDEKVDVERTGLEVPYPDWYDTFIETEEPEA